MILENARTVAAHAGRTRACPVEYFCMKIGPYDERSDH
jgi:hypothetical protein